MVCKIVWSHEAVSDLEAIAAYIHKDSPFYASAFVQEIWDVGCSLDQFAKRGRIVSEIGRSNIRELFVKNHRLIYSIEKSRVSILAVVHGARDLKSVWKKRNDV